MFSTTIPYAKFHLEMMRRLVSSPLQWPKDSPVLIVVDCEKTRRRHLIRLIAHGMYGTGMTVSSLSKWREMEVTQQMPALVFIGGYVLSFVIRLEFLRKERDLQRLVKALLQFEESHEGAKAAKKDLVTVTVQLMGILISPVMAVLLGVLLSALPCMPPFLGFTLGLCDGPGLKWLWRIAIASFDAYMWSAPILPACFYVLGSFVVGMRCLEYNLRYAKSLLESKSYSGFRVYRRVEVLGELFNELYQGLIVPAMMMGIWVTFLSGLYGCVKLHERVAMPGFAFFPFTLLVSLVAVVGLGLGVGVVRASERCLEVTRRKEGKGRRSLYRRMARGMRRVKVRLGSTNWIDHLTPFNLLNHALNNCVTVMLLS